MNLILLLQEASAAHWYDTPTGFAAIAALAGVIIAPFINQWIQNRKTRQEKAGHLTDTTLSINREERKEAVDLMKSLHAREIATFTRQMVEQDRRHDRDIIDCKVREYDARQRAHSYGNECNRVVGHLYRQDAILMQHGIATPAFVYKTYPEIMDGLDEKVAEYRKELELEAAARRRDDEELSGETEQQ